MHRPCFIVIDREFPGSISTRKLVLETAKYNVITAYTSSEALDLLRRFPNVDGIVMDSTGHDEPCDQLVSRLRSISPKTRIALTSGRDYADCGKVDLQLDNYDPRKLLDAMALLFPAENASLNAHDDAVHHAFKTPEDK